MRSSSVAAGPIRRSRSERDARDRRSSTSCAITASGSTCAMPTSCSACFSGSIGRTNSRAPAWGWPWRSASSSGTAAASGRTAKWTAAPRSSSPSAPSVPPPHSAPAGIAGIPCGPYPKAHDKPDPMAAAVALSVSHDPAGAGAPAAAGDALARPGGVRLSDGGARVGGDGADVVRDGSPFAATLYAVLWTLLVYVVHNPVSLAGWGAGGLIGIALARAARAPSPSLGTLAVVLTVGTVVVAKALILAFALRPILVDEIVRHPEATRAVYVLDMTTHRTFSPDLQAALDTLPRRGGDTARADVRALMAFELQDRIIAEARARDSAATPAERERLGRTYSDHILGREGFLAMLGKLFSFWDLLWLGLGVSSAWKLAQSVTR